MAATTGMIPAAWNSTLKNTTPNPLRIALVGTGIRGVNFWGKNLQEQYSDVLTFAALCDINPGRLEFARKHIGGDCPVFTDFDRMLEEVKPDLLIVTTVDSTHHEFIVKGLKAGINVITEKPLTTEDWKCREILKAEEESGKQVIVGFNYRWSPHATRLKELLEQKRVGDISSVDFHWYLNVYHGASYFRRWHGIMERGGSLWVHKSTHHFDLLNWWLDSDPIEVSAYGALEHYGANHKFRGPNCRNCAYTDDCKFYYDITKSNMYMKLYVENEKYDGYIRDNCLWRSEIDIYDKMSAQIKYANGVIVNYSLTTYSPYEGWRIAFNGMSGRIESWQDIPWRKKELTAQAQLHAAEMNQSDAQEFEDFEEIMIMDNFAEDYEMARVDKPRGGHGGGDRRLQDRIFRNREEADPLKHSAGSRDGAMSILIGIAARKSIELNRPVKISEVTDLEPMAKRPAYFTGINF